MPAIHMGWAGDAALNIRLRSRWVEAGMRGCRATMRTWEERRTDARRVLPRSGRTYVRASRVEVHALWSVNGEPGRLPCHVVRHFRYYTARNQSWLKRWSEFDEARYAKNVPGV